MPLQRRRPAPMLRPRSQRLLQRMQGGPPGWIRSLRDHADRSGTKAKFARYREHLRTTGLVSPGILASLRRIATIPYPCHTGGPQYAFSRHAGIYRSDVTRLQPILGSGPTSSRRSAPGPGKRTRREDHALLIVRDEFRSGYSLIGLLASRARRRFTGHQQS